MKIEIRKSFTKDADKLPAPFRRHLAENIKAMEKATHLQSWWIVKNLLDIKLLIEFEWVNTASVFIMRIKQLSLSEYFIEKRSIAIFHKNKFTSQPTPNPYSSR